MGDFINSQSFGLSTLCKNNKFDAMGMITPINVVKDMVDLLPDNVWNKDTKFLDIACKSGNFLREIYLRLMNCKDLKEYKPNKEDRSEYIRKNQIYGICINTSDKYISARNVFGYNAKEHNIRYINNWVDAVTHKDKQNKLNITFMKDKIQEAFGDSMKFNVIVGNPPYNNDIYLDFVIKSKALGAEHICMITPAKWQTKGGDKNEQFRTEIIPYISDIVYYPEAKDIFDIICQGGICYYLIDKDIHKLKKLNTYCKNVKSFETSGTETIELTNILYNKNVRSIANKLDNCSKLQCNNDSIKKYIVGITNVYSEKELTNTKGKANVIISPYVQVDSKEKKNADTSFLISFDTLEEANSYISYLNTKLVRFGFLIGKVSQHLQSDYCWKFVPDPGAFDHIFTDEELYKKYSLTEEEIAIIESVIKERK